LFGLEQFHSMASTLCHMDYTRMLLVAKAVVLWVMMKACLIPEW
jgi:hypothetical protein